MSALRSRYATVAAGIVGTFGWLVLSLSVFSRSELVVGLIVVQLGTVGAPLFGGFVAGYLTTGTRRNGAVNGTFSGLLAGFLLGFFGTAVFLIGTRTHPPTTWTVSELVALAGTAAVVVGSFFGNCGRVGGLFGHYTRFRDG